MNDDTWSVLSTPTTGALMGTSESRRQNVSPNRVSPNVLYVGDVVPVRIFRTSEPFMATVVGMTPYGVRVFAPSEDPMVDQEHVVGYEGFNDA